MREVVEPAAPGSINGDDGGAGGRDAAVDNEGEREGENGRRGESEGSANETRGS
jgi:hypothetical protein